MAPFSYWLTGCLCRQRCQKQGFQILTKFSDISQAEISLAMGLKKKPVTSSGFVHLLRKSNSSKLNS